MMFRVDLSGKRGRRSDRRVRAQLLRRGDGSGRDLVRVARAERIRCEDQRHRRTGRVHRQDPLDVTTKLLGKVYHLRNLERAWHVIQENGRLSKSEEVRAELQAFAEDASTNLRSLQYRLTRSLFQFEPAKGV